MENEKPPTAESPEAPELAAAVGWLYHHFTVNWRLFVKPQVLGALLLFLAAGWYFGSNKSEEKLELRNERIALLQEQISAYHDRLQGASPDQAAKQLAEMASNLDIANKKLRILLPDNPRSLTIQQKRFIADHKADFSAVIGKSLPVYAWSVGDAQIYATDFVVEFSKYLLPPQGPIAVPCLASQKGIMVGVPDLNKIGDNPRKFKDLLEQMGLSVAYTTWGVDAMYRPNDFDLFICG